MGLRESKKLRTRQEIADRAMALFAKRGFDHVTVAEIALAVGISEKTVFNYFRTKEDIFFDEVEDREQALVDAIRNRAPGESVAGALERLQAQGCPRMCSPGFAIFARIVEESPALQAKELEIMARLTEVLAEAIRTELGVDELEAKIAGNVLVAVHWQLFRSAREQALAGRNGPAAVRRLRADLKRAYRLLEHGLATLERADTEAGVSV
jgi:AcrR family transcriptional regulator